MKKGLRRFLSQFMAAVIVLASGATGYAAYVPHGDHAGIVHILGDQVAHHHGHHGHEIGDQARVLLCDVNASCDAEPGDGAAHVHASCIGSPGLAPGDCDLNFAGGAGEKPSASAALPFLQDLTFSLLRPPRIAL
jgi:hypothetical protein